MKTTIIVVLTLLAWSFAADPPAKIEKRGVFSEGVAYGNEGDVNVFQQQHEQLLSAADLQPDVNSRFFTSLGLQLAPQQVSYRPLQSAQPIWTPVNSGYNYPSPVGNQLLEEPVPRFFNFLIPPAIRPLPFPQFPNTRHGPGYQYPRRVTTDVNKNLFYKYPGVISPPGLVISLPVPNARPTRIVVPQHGPVAIGSGGLGYSALPGGRIALGSGARGFSNLALARAFPLPPRPPYSPSQKTNPFSIPEASPVQRALNTIQNPSGEFAGSLTVFPLPNDGISKNPVYNFK